MSVVRCLDSVWISINKKLKPCRVVNSLYIGVHCTDCSLSKIHWNDKRISCSFLKLRNVQHCESYRLVQLNQLIVWHVHRIMQQDVYSGVIMDTQCKAMVTWSVEKMVPGHVIYLLVKVIINFSLYHIIILILILIPTLTVILAWILVTLLYDNMEIYPIAGFTYYTIMNINTGCIVLSL
jgi:hypothetical protein